MNEDKIHILKIPRGHARINLHRNKETGKFTMIFSFAEKYIKPGKEAPNDEPVFPIVGIELWGKENAEIIGNAFLKAAKIMEDLNAKG